MPVYGAVDVHYPDGGGARAALVVSTSPDFAVLSERRTVWLDHAEPYVPGEFYRREMPPVLAVLEGAPTLDVLVVDGYVTLDPSGRPGLGARLAAAGAGEVVVGVSKTRFAAATHAVEVLRGGSRRPLLVTSTGIDVRVAARLVEDMAGGHRIPDALRLVDRLCRGSVEP